MYGAIYMDKATQVSIEALKRIRDGRSVPSAGDNGTDSALTPTRRKPDHSGVIAWPSQSRCQMAWRRSNRSARISCRMRSRHGLTTSRTACSVRPTMWL